ncbi:MAG: L-lysine 6-transaminase [Oligoflexia bacterium]|nr:L-lysine 6-transaminase [Oligoflexia bacterium]
MAGLYTAQNTFEVLKRHILVDGFPVVVDFEKSRGVHMVDAVSGKTYFDFFSFYASNPIGFNHPKMNEPDFLKKLTRVSKVKPVLADIYTPEYAEFVDTLASHASRNHFKHFFFIEGGALAVENALKAAFDWKVRKNLQKGKGEKGYQVIHFEQAFHGRSGYTMSLTNTDPQKIMYFPKFDWPRIKNPKLTFPLTPQGLEDVQKSEKQAIDQILSAIQKNPDDLAALIMEPIQSEGGDNHFRPEFLKRLREICDAHDILLIFDEVQTGFGLTGSFWAWEQFGVKPDLISFGKKSQTCGIASSARIDEVDNVFKISSRINSTFGGNLTDMVRCTQYLKIMDEENLLANASKQGDYIQSQLRKLSQRFSQVTNIRGRGLLIAFDLPTGADRDKFRRIAWELGLLVLICGDRSIRLRPVLDITSANVDEAVSLFESTLKKLYS